MSPRPPRRQDILPIEPPSTRLAPACAAASPPLLPAEWLDETLTRARALLHRDDPFMQALERQHEPIA